MRVAVDTHRPWPCLAQHGDIGIACWHCSPSKHVSHRSMPASSPLTKLVRPLNKTPLASACMVTTREALHGCLLLEREMPTLWFHVGPEGHARSTLFTIHKSALQYQMHVSHAILCGSLGPPMLVSMYIVVLYNCHFPVSNRGREVTLP